MFISRLGAQESLSATIEDWRLLFSESRFRALASAEYNDLDFLKNQLRVGRSKLLSTEVDVQVLQLIFASIASKQPLVLGTPYAPCHWSAIALSYFLVGRGNHSLHQKRRIAWIRPNRMEVSFFQHIRIPSGFGRLVDSIDIRRSQFDKGSSSKSELLYVDVLSPEIAQKADAILISDAIGIDQDTFTLFKEARRLAFDNCTPIVLILPTKNLKPDASGLFWPMSNSTLNNAHVLAARSDKHINDIFADGAHFAGKTKRIIHECALSSRCADAFTDASAQASKLMNLTADWHTRSAVYDFQRLVSYVRQICLPIDQVLTGEGGITAKINSLRSRLHAIPIAIRDDIDIGLLTLEDAITEISLNNTKRIRFDRLLSEHDPQKRLLILQPQADEVLDQRVLLYVKDFLHSLHGRNAISTQLNVSSHKLALHNTEGTAISTGLPKYKTAAFWRLPFNGSLHTLCFSIDSQKAIWANLDERSLSERDRVETWRLISNIPTSISPKQTINRSVVYEGLQPDALSLAEAVEIPRLNLTTGIIGTQVARQIGGTAPEGIGILVTFEGGDKFRWFPGEEHFVLTSDGVAGRVKSVKTSDLVNGDRVILVDGESYATLWTAVRDRSDNISSAQSFIELYEEWQYLCIEANETTTSRRKFIQDVRAVGCLKSEAAISSWLSLRVLGPDSADDILKCAYAAGRYNLIAHVNTLFAGLEKRRNRHRRLGHWLNRALGASAMSSRLENTIADPDLQITLGNLREAIRIQQVIHVEASDA